MKKKYEMSIAGNVNDVAVRFVVRERDLKASAVVEKCLPKNTAN